MIFTECTECGTWIVDPYEAGDKPRGPNVYARHVCGFCGAISYVQLVSLGGETLSEAEAIRRGIAKKGGVLSEGEMSDETVTFSGYWSPNDQPRQKSREEAALEEAARTGAIVPWEVVIDGMSYRTRVRVTKAGDGSFDCHPVARATRKLLLPSRGPERLPS